MHPRLRSATLTAALAVTAPSWAREPEPAKPAPSAQPAPTSTPPRYRVATSEAPRYGLSQGKGSATLLLNPGTGATAASLQLLELQPGAAVPEHLHEGSVEILYIEEGEAEMTVAGQTLRVRKGDAVYIPAGAKHSAKVVSEKAALRAVQVYAGPGPELRFTQGPRLDKAPAPGASEQPGKR
jgi:quercetin dioxygenase-like cupin family protein